MHHKFSNKITHNKPAPGIIRRLSFGAAVTAGIGIIMPLLTVPPATAALPKDDAAATPVRSCGSLATVAFDSLPEADVTVDSAVLESSVDAAPRSCQVQLSINHPPAENSTTVWVHLPVDTWNGRFQGMGGGGFSGGDPQSLAKPLSNGYATAATDGGHPGSHASFALDEDGNLNWQAIKDFGHLAIHEMTVTAKTLIREYYGTAAEYSYFNGCSTGGRQGMAEAQRYPADYDGILSGAPVFNWAKLQVAQIWGQVVMNEENNFVPGCKFDAVTAAAVEACDTLGDGIADGVIGDPTRCNYDPAQFVGTTTDCGIFTSKDAEVVRKIWEGPRTTDGQFLWYGLTPGTSLTGLNGTTEVNGELVGTPFPYVINWIKYWVLQDPDWDWTTMGYQDFEEVFKLSVEKFREVAGTANADLSGFRQAGGKLLMWHGFSDFGVYPEGTLDYYQRVTENVGSEAKTRKFYRLFMAPGVGHCGGGPGAQPTGMFAALVDWVESGDAPKRLTAVQTADGEVTATRPLCPWPSMAIYKGNSGDPADADNYVCRTPNPGVGYPGDGYGYSRKGTTAATP